MKAKTILDAEKKDAIDIATELCYSEEVKRKIAQAKSVYECPHMPRLEEQVAMAHKLRKEIEKMANGYRNALVQQIKDAGQELINRAESMVHPENDLITDFSIVIHFEQHEVPTIDYTTSVVNKVACDRVIYQKGESNVSKI